MRAWQQVLVAYRITQTAPPFSAGVRALAARLAGRSVGIVLAGGGARAFAHLGVLLELEEAGIEAEVVSLIGVLDGLRLGFARIPLYSLVFHLRMTGGALRGHPLETRAVGFFGRDALPEPLAGASRWLDLAFAAIGGEHPAVDFDLPRTPPWRGQPSGEGNVSSLME